MSSKRTTPQGLTLNPKMDQWPYAGFWSQPRSYRVLWGTAPDGARHRIVGGTKKEMRQQRAFYRRSTYWSDLAIRPRRAPKRKKI